MPVRIRCVDLSKRYGEASVLDGLNWAVDAAGVVGLLGRSGTGKSTLLRLIAGLEHPESGRIELDPPTARVGMVFQNLALWPHLTARRHVELTATTISRRERRETAERLLVEVCLPSDAWDRRPAELSGGEAQRLAVARALSTHPELLMLDEPLAQVDTVLRDELLDLIRHTVDARSITALFITHSWREAMRISDRVALIDSGRIIQEGTPEDLFWHPIDADVARLTGPVVEIPRAWLMNGQIGGCDLGLDSGLETNPIVVRPQQIHRIEPSEKNRWQVIACRPRGRSWQVDLLRADQRLSIRSAGPLDGSHEVGIEIHPVERCSLHSWSKYDKRED